MVKERIKEEKMVREEELIDELKTKYEEKLKKELMNEEEEIERKKEKVYSQSYEEFRKQYMPAHVSMYEKLCQLAEKTLKVKVSKKRREKLEQDIKRAHLNVSPEGVSSLALITPIIVFLFFAIVGYGLQSILLGDTSMFIIIVGLIFSLISYYLMEKFPEYLANGWRIKASNQLVLAVFYLSTYLRHTPNLEKAVEFTSNHLMPPLGLDFKRILWEVESNKYSTIKEAIDHYLDQWINDAPEFVDAVHLLESSVYEASEDRRMNTLDKALDLILEETYDKMLHYSHSLKSPITMIHMLGIVLPILSLVLLPLVVSFMEGVKWYHLVFLYNLLIPLIVFLLIKKELNKRPSSYSGKSIEEIAPLLKKSSKKGFKVFGMKKYLSASIIALMVATPLILIGLSPIIIHTINPSFDINLIKGDEEELGGVKFLNYKETCTLDIYGNKNCSYKGPFGIGATILSIFLTLGIGLGLSIYYKYMSRDLKKIRDKIKKLEQEFASALFQLANRLGDELPIEVALKKVAETSKGTTTSMFFETIYSNMTKLGYDLERAIFDEKVGAIKIFPSPLVEGSMKVLVDSVKKGPLVASKALINISTYVRNINRVEERLKDLMSDELSSMKTQISFIAPVISGIVIGITSMITTILINLQEKMNALNELTQNAGSFSTYSGLLELFKISIPTYYFQIIVGLYLIEVVYLLTLFVNGIENGEDKLEKQILLGKNFFSATSLYSLIALIVITIFNLLAINITAQGI